MSVKAVQSVRMVTANILLSVFFLSGALADCGHVAALFITAPQEMEALTGSCLQIPCNFRTKSEEEFSSTRTTFGVWIKDSSDFDKKPYNVVFNSSKNGNIYPMILTGDLSRGNCTTLFSILNTSYTNKYFFRIENGPFLATAVCNPLQISVTDSPPKPRIEISDNLKEKESVSISCSASTPCPQSPPELTLNLRQDLHIMTEENTDRTFTTKIQKILTLSDKHDGFTISCSARYPVNEGKYKMAEVTKTLSVSYAPKDTLVSISPSGSVSAGSWVNLTCSSRANPPIRSFTWFKKSNDGLVRVSEGGFYRFNVTDGGVYYCVATNQLGNETSEIRLTVEGEGTPLLGPVLGGIIGIIVLLGLFVCFWRLKKTHPTAQQSQNLTVEGTASTREEVHYGEINFSRPGPEQSSTSVQDSGQQQETLYAQVKVSETAKRSTQTADGTEDIYTQVKRK